MATSESKGRFFYETNRFESIRITNRIDSNRELECSTIHCHNLWINHDTPLPPLTYYYQIRR